jgi:6-phosphogluconolactonase/glucosamine-6-phosphate isomerase/deaminase
MPLPQGSGLQFVKCDNKNDAAVQAGSFLSQELIRYSDKSTLILVSGGSSLSMFEYIDDAALRSNLFLGQVDERWTKNTRDLNAEAFRKTSFAKKTAEFGIPFVTMDVSGSPTPEECAIRYERYLKQWRSVFFGGVIIAVLGIGSDGHVAGVLPYPSAQNEFNTLFYDTRAWVIGYETGGRGEFKERVSLSLHFLLQEPKSVFVYACGKDKQEALQKAFSPDGTFADTPARILNQMGSVFLFSDAI